jgi:hypothetical protein
MESIRCPHGLKINLPTTEKEFLEEKFHVDIQKLNTHLEEFSECKFKSCEVHSNSELCNCGHVYEYHFPEGCISGHCPCKQDNRGNEK